MSGVFGGGKKDRRREEEEERRRREAEMASAKNLKISERQRRARTLLSGATGDAQTVGAPTILGA